ncbi:MAG TPA: hypothetical protein VJ986_05690 [Gaiellaceae bacterium]|nr:hypothetical protein [Gaiellaceae bacterium]
MTTPPIDTTQMPAAVQKSGPKAQQLYATALQFEQLLVTELAQQLQQTDGSSSDSGSGDGTTALYRQMLPGALAQGITDAGGIGLAGELYQSLAAGQGIQAAPATQSTQGTQGAAGKQGAR